MKLLTTCDYTCATPPIQPPPKSGFGFLTHALDSLETLPSVQNALEAIATTRRRARPGYPPTAMFRAFCLKYLLGECYTVAIIERLRSSTRLRAICGFGYTIPSESTFSRFFSRLASVSGLTDTAIAEMVERIRKRLPDVGERVAVDSTDVRAHANPKRSVVRDTVARWGHRTTKARSKSKAKTEPFFGYKLHAISDAVHGVPLAHVLLPANANDSPQLRRLLDRAQAAYRWLKPTHLLADRGYDSQANHRLLAKRGISPVIHIRKPTAEDKLHDGLYDRLGRPVCGDGTPMEYLLTDQGMHKFRCPTGGCALKARSNGSVRYCDTDALWVDPADNLRAIGMVARASPEWKRLYARRQSIERMFGSLKRSRLLDRHQYARFDKVRLHVGLSVLTYLATMLTRVQAGDLGKIRHMRIRVV